jgi:hypothetical protein
VATVAKATLIQQCKAAGIPLPESADKKVLEHRLKNWLPGKGWLFRLARPTTRKTGHPVQMLEDWATVYWVPNSKMAEIIAKSNLVFILGRSITPPRDSTMLDVPKDFTDRWQIGDTDGGN